MHYSYQRIYYKSCSNIGRAGGIIMKLLLSGCAMAALVVGLSSQAGAQVAVGDAPIHAIPPGDAQTGPVLNGPAAPVVQAAPPAPAAAQPMVLADASQVRPPAATSENTLIASLNPPKPAPAVLTEDEAAFFAALGRRVTDAATAYDGYVRHAAAIDPAFSDAASVQRAVRSGSDYQPAQLQQGIVAYAAMIALRSPAFVDGVRARAAADPSFADRLAAQPAEVLQVPGAQAAAMDVASVLHAHGVALQSTGKAIGKAAYDVQAQAWSKTPVANPVEVLAGVKASAATLRTADAPSEKALLLSLVSAPRGDAASAPSATPAVVRGMAIAALAVMGRAGDREELRIQTLLEDEVSAACLKMATLNTNQCLAAAGPHYDDIFCVGEHSVGETARCVSTAADGGPGQMQPDPGMRVAAADTERGQAYGPEQAVATQGSGPGADPGAAAPQQVADAAPYPAGDGTLNGQVYARRAAQQRAGRQEEQPARYADQDAPPPAPRPAYQQPAYPQPVYQQPAYQQAPAQYGYYGQGGGYAPSYYAQGGGYYAPPPPAYAQQGYPSQ
jgi:hypothetical protein